MTREEVDNYNNLWNELPRDQRMYFTSMILSMANGMHNNKVDRDGEMKPLYPSETVLCPNCGDEFKHRGYTNASANKDL